jgi:hypothetical protein
LHDNRRYKGVCWYADRQKWEAQWYSPDTRKSVHGGYFATAEAAALCYDAAVRKHGGKCVNFPDKGVGETQAHAGVQPPRPLAASGFRGVYANGDRFMAGISVDGRRKHLGAFATAEDAARAYDSRARELGWPAARLNFAHDTSVQAPVPLQLGAPGENSRIGASGFRGVTLQNGNHAAHIYYAGGRKRRLGAFETAEEAARAYNAAARKAGKPLNNIPDAAAHDTHIKASAGGAATAPDGAAAQQGKKRMRTAASADAADVQAKRAQLTARLAALERALSDAKAAEAGSATRASALQAELAASQAHVTELRACGDALHEENEHKRARAERTEAATAATVQALERETRCPCCECLDARRDTLSFACSHPLCAGCGARLARCPSCGQRRKRRPPLRIF